MAGTTLTSIILAAALAAAAAQAQMRTLNPAGGGRIVYGLVDGAGSQAAAMSSVLKSVQAGCGEKPKVGKVFRERGTGSAAVFFTVVNHLAGDKAVAGLIIAAQPASGRFEAALVSDAAERFGWSVNPMLQQLFGVWRPAGLEAAATPGHVGRSAGPAPLHPYTTPDRSARAAIPVGWKAQGQGGGMFISGPHGEGINLGLSHLMADPSGQGQRQARSLGMRANPAGPIIYPANIDLARAFPDLFTQFWRMNHCNPTGLRMETCQRIPMAGGQCVHVTGHVRLSPELPEREMLAILTTSRPSAMGNYTMLLTVALVPLEAADASRATVGAIIASYEPDMQVIGAQANAIAAPALSAIREIGRRAAANYAATDRANEAQHQTWRAGQDSQEKRNQGFCNYLLDQSVIRDNDHNAHGTAWNGTAEVLVKADPNRFQYVEPRDYWKGIDH